MVQINGKLTLPDLSKPNVTLSRFAAAVAVFSFPTQNRMNHPFSLEAATATKNLPSI